MARAGTTESGRLLVDVNLVGVLESVNVIMTVLVAAVVGVPLITPVVVLMLSPAGSPEAAQV
jgi:hypothetical protein